MGRFERGLAKIRRQDAQRPVRFIVVPGWRLKLTVENPLTLDELVAMDTDR